MDRGQRVLLRRAALRSVGWGALAVLVAAPAGAADFRGYGLVEGSAGFVSERNAHPNSVTVPGFRVEAGAGFPAVPMTLGIAAGTYVLDRHASVEERPGGASYRIVFESRDLRYVEAVLRVQPDFAHVRPFASASIGWIGAWSRATEGAARVDEARLHTGTSGIRHGGPYRLDDHALTASLTLGLDIEALRRREWALAVTLGVRASETGLLASGAPELPESRLRIIAPFVALTIAGGP